jgi:hypothetical protein
MSGYLQYSNYGDEDEPPMKRKVPPTQSDATIKPSQMSQPTQPTQPTQPKRILRTNQRTLRSKPTQQQSQEPQAPQKQHIYVQELIQNIHSYEDGTSDSDGDNNYAPDAAAIRQQFQTEAVPNRNRFAGASGTDLNARLNPAPTKEAFSLHSANQYMPSVFQASSNATDVANKDVLLQKLDHIISLLEDQQDAKTGHVTEELVLYCFLGVFIIFIVDSFARAGKYVR